MRIALVACLVLGVATRASADARITAKMHCQSEYAGDADMDAACERGVDLAARLPTLARAGAACARDAADASAAADARATACRHGVTLHARAAGAARLPEKSTFSYGWRQGRGAVQAHIGGYDVTVGDAQRSMEQCMRDFEGSKTPPSCISGLSVQPRSPRDASPRAEPR